MLKTIYLNIDNSIRNIFREEKLKFVSDCNSYHYLKNNKLHHPTEPAWISKVNKGSVEFWRYGCPLHFILSDGSEIKFEIFKNKKGEYESKLISKI